jgi:hypothetical protein
MVTKSTYQKKLTVGTSYLQPHSTEVILLYKLPGNTGIFVDPYYGNLSFIKARYEFDEHYNIILHEMDRYESIIEALQKIKNPLELTVKLTYHCNYCDKYEIKEATITDINSLADILHDVKYQRCPDCGNDTFEIDTISRDDGSECYGI